jgi:serine/threonine protein kinase
MGAVFKAMHAEMERVVALKVLPPDRMRSARAVARFKREVKAIARLNHPNIVQAYDAREIDAKHVLVMEYVDGLDLSELVRRCGPLRVTHGSGTLGDCTANCRTRRAGRRWPRARWQRHEPTDGAEAD